MSQKTPTPADLYRDATRLARRSGAVSPEQVVKLRTLLEKVMRTILKDCEEKLPPGKAQEKQEMLQAVMDIGGRGRALADFSLQDLIYVWFDVRPCSAPGKQGGGIGEKPDDEPEALETRGPGVGPRASSKNKGVARWWTTVTNVKASPSIFSNRRLFDEFLERVNPAVHDRPVRKALEIRRSQFAFYAAFVRWIIEAAYPDEVAEVAENLVWARIRAAVPAAIVLAVGIVVGVIITYLYLYGADQQPTPRPGEPEPGVPTPGAVTEGGVPNAASSLAEDAAADGGQEVGDERDVAELAEDAAADGGQKVGDERHVAEPSDASGENVARPVGDGGVAPQSPFGENADDAEVRDVPPSPVHNVPAVDSDVTEPGPIVEDYGGADAAVKDGALDADEVTEHGWDLPEDPPDLEDDDAMADYWDRNG